MKSRSRRESSFNRKSGKRPPRARILIVCEGKKTEPLYFKALWTKLRVPTVEVVVMPQGEGSEPISVVDYAIKLRDERSLSSPGSMISTEYDEVWCVMDVEIPQRDSLDRALTKAIAHKLKVALSNPCFEYWYILHFKHTAHRMQSNNEVIRLLKKHHSAYHKSDDTIFEIVFPNTKEAIRRSRNIIKENGWGEELQHCNPSTHVHRIVERLFTLSKKPY